MTNLRLQLLISVILITGHVFGDNVDVPPPQPPAPIPSTTTPLSTTSPVPTTPPTPTTPSTKPTSMSKPTTPSTTKQTTPTTPSTTPSPPPPPTTPAPLPPKPVDPSKGMWSVKYENSNNTCIRIQFAMQAEIPYFHVNEKKMVNATVDVPVNATIAEGVCYDEKDKDNEKLIIQWINKDNFTSTATFIFGQNETSKTYVINNIELHIFPDEEQFPGIDNKNNITLNHNLQEFKTSLSKSYKCEKKQNLSLTDITNQPRGYIYISQLQLQAFANSTDNSFSSAEDCDSSDTPDVVPIAVGCALAILVIAVLIAYLIGRRRRQARGYLSM